MGDGALVRIGNRRGSVILHAVLDECALPGTLVVEGIWPSASFIGGNGINSLVNEAPVPPNGGVGFHDTAVWLEAVTDEKLARRRRFGMAAD